MGSVSLPGGFRFAGVACGIRGDADRRDLALVVSDRPAAAAGVFTQNRVCAAPVKVSRQRVPADDIRGIVVCSGNANACTGEQGITDARWMTELTAKAIGCRAHQVLVASTGVIGRPLPMEKIAAGIPTAAARLAGTPEALSDAANAILTTDTRVKVAHRSLGEHRLLGFAKGAAMIGPNLATMLAFVLTDAAVAPAELQAILRDAADRSFNCVRVEGHTSTNDTVFLLANGTGPPLNGDDLGRFGEAVQAVCVDLAKAIAADAEGAEHLVTVEVQGLANDADARRVAVAVADSPLVKAAVYGGDPNWGRVVSAAGYAGVEFHEEQLSCWLGETLLYDAGVPVPFDAAAASAHLKQNREVSVRLKFDIGTGRCTIWTCDLTPDYVRLNADYTT